VPLAGRLVSVLREEPLTGRRIWVRSGRRLPKDKQELQRRLRTMVDPAPSRWVGGEWRPCVLPGSAPSSFRASSTGRLQTPPLTTRSEMDSRPSTMSGGRHCEQGDGLGAPVGDAENELYCSPITTAAAGADGATPNGSAAPRPRHFCHNTASRNTDKFNARDVWAWSGGRCLYQERGRGRGGGFCGGGGGGGLPLASGATQVALWAEPRIIRYDFPLTTHGCARQQQLHRPP
jgi:hypothetical protein